MRNKIINAVAACLSGCILFAGLSGCCTHRGCCDGPVAKEPEAEAAPTPPVPAALDYPRFHPVPTRPVFLPEGVEPVPAQAQLQPTDPPALTAVPNDGWRSVGK